MDSLLEHYMPSLMALKKALPARQPGSFRESFISVDCFYKVIRNIEGNLKLHKKKSESEKDKHRGSGSMP